MTDFYERRRRLAIAVAAATAFLIAVWLLYGGFPETCSDPTVCPAPDALYVTYRAGRMREEKIVQYLLSLDRNTLDVKSRQQFYDLSLALWSPKGLIGFFGDGYQYLHAEGKVSHLDQDWPIVVAARDPATETFWLFGGHGRSLKARTLRDGTAGAVEEVAKTGADIEAVEATFSPEAGVGVVWKEKDRAGLKAARRVGDRFERMADLPTGDTTNWTAVRVGPRLLAVYFDRRDQSWSMLKLRVRCCTECGLPPPQSEWVFRDPFMLLARRVTGITSAVDGDRVRLIITRAMALQTASVPVAALAPEPGASLVSIRTESLWRRVLGVAMPSLLMLFSVYLVYLGGMLLRQRRRVLAGLPAEGPPGAEPQYADTMQRAVAFVIDQALIFPLIYVTAESMGHSIEAIDLSDPRFLQVIAAGYLINVVYFFVQEAWTGQTIGKRLVGIRVVNAAGDRLTFGRAAARNVLRCLDAYNYLVVVGLAFLLLTRRKQRLGDIIAGTVVVQSRREAAK